jgi:hypothetical protein
VVIRLRARSTIAAAVLAAVLATAIATSPAPAGAVGTVTLVAVVDTSAWRRPSPDPMGLALDPGSGNLILVDSEVEETPRWSGANTWSITTAMHPTRSWRTTAFSNEPTDVALRGRRTMFLTDDNVNRLFVIQLGPDRRSGTRDDVVRSFSTKRFGSSSPQGLTYADGALFLTDGEGAAVYRIEPGPNRRFDGVGRMGDDVVSSFSTLDLGVTFPSGCAFDPTTGHLLLVSQNAAEIVVATTAGQAVDRYDLSDSGIAFPSSIELAPSSVDGSVRFAYVADRGIDNNFKEGGDPDENDGRIFEFALAGA